MLHINELTEEIAMSNLLEGDCREIISRKIEASVKQCDGLLHTTVSQIDTLHADPPVKYEFSIVGEFDENLVLREIRVTKMEGSRGDICYPAKEALQALVGTQVGTGFNTKMREVYGPSGCMHFPALLEQMATMAFRSRLAEVLRTKGKEAFIQFNQDLFKGKCVGYR
ncbi:hypothetical protein B6V01_004265 [Methanosarcinales archaeon ex4572_44]|nr:MAG: hypothetical protein B6U67_05835 [Methanosarcinales archaeon ex4484_138]PHP45410.1 MAG: hypothetical protein B6V01_004265 [Methanosarcinales archaeon ex4572_44]